jgi:hypothetical protein
MQLRESIGVCVAAGLWLAGCTGADGVTVDTARYRVDSYAHVQTPEFQRSLPLMVEPERGSPYQEFRVLMAGEDRVAFHGLHGVPAFEGEVPPHLRPLLDRRERFLREHGTRVRFALADSDLAPGMGQDEAETILNEVLRGAPVWRSSADDNLPRLTEAGELDYSHDVIERVAWDVFNGFHKTRVFVHFRNGTLERWEVHAERRE